MTRVLALLSKFKGEYAFEKIDIGMIEPDSQTGKSITQWGAIRVDFYHFNGMHPRSFRSKVKESF